MSKYIEAIRKRQIIRIERLLVNTKFLAEVSEIRQIWKIPKDGLKTKQQADEWTSWYSFIEEKDFYIQYKLLPALSGHLSTINNFKYEDFQSYVAADFIKSIKSLIKEHQLDATWFFPMHQYVLLNDANVFDKIGVGVRFDLPFYDKYGNLTIKVHINELTTKNDILQTFSYLTKQFFKNKRKNQPTSNIKVYKYIVELKNKGYSNKDLLDKLNEHFKNTYSYNQLNKMLHEMKKTSS